MDKGTDAPKKEDGSDPVPDDAASSDGEDEIDLEYEVRDDLVRRYRKYTLNDRVKKAPKRFLQQVSYATLVEDRILDLEQRLKIVEGKPASEREPPPKDPYEVNQDISSQLKLDVRRMTFEEYKPLRNITNPLEHLDWHKASQEKIRENISGYLIDVVVNINNNIDEPVQEHLPKKPPSQNPSTNAGEPGSISEPQSVYATPERIRINSPLLCNVLEEITGEKFAPTRDLSQFRRDPRTQVILRPFKLLVLYEQEIRAHVRTLTDQVESATTKSGASSGAAITDSSNVLGSADANPVSTAGRTGSGTFEGSLEPSEAGSVDLANEGKGDAQLQCRLDSLKVLVEMFDKDFKATFDLRRQIDEGSLRSIAFADLWHLFRHETEIRSGSDVNHAQIYRILNVTGGRAFLCSRETVDMDPEFNTRDPIIFTIQCFHYDTDGKNIGPTQKIFHMKKYDGVKPVTSLPCYPVQFSKIIDNDSARAGFIARGKRFMQLINNSEVVHRRYEGLTLSIPELAESGKEDMREEVRRHIQIKSQPLTVVGGL